MRPAPRARHRPSILLALAVAIAALGAWSTSAIATSSPLGGNDTGSATPAAAGAPALTPAIAAHVAALQGLNPNQIRSAYALPATGAHGQTVAIVSAYDDPGFESDLAAYDKRFGQPSCPVRNGCIRRLNQDGHRSPLPVTDVTGGTWITETALGTELVHGLCNSCKLLLVEADTDTESNLSKAVHSAIAAGATVVVTTFTPPEDPGNSGYSADYSDPRAAVVAAAGDPFAGQFGYTGGLNFPAALPSVLAVGGTQLSLGAHGGYGSERAWDGTVSGCSIYQDAPPWQKAAAAAANCGSGRPNSDLAAVADPGAIVHIAGVDQPGGPWYVAQGTSMSAPVIGAVIGLAGSAGGNEARMLYQRAQTDPGALHDIVTGENAPGCRSVICKAQRGWDGPTGLGTPAGLEAFLPGGPAISSRHPRISIAGPPGVLHASHRWRISLDLANGNPFRISGTIVLRRTLLNGGRSRVLTLGSATLRRGSLQASAVAMTIGRSTRSLISRSGPLTVWAFARVSGASGHVVTVKRKLSVIAP